MDYKEVDKNKFLPAWKRKTSTFYGNFIILSLIVAVALEIYGNKTNNDAIRTSTIITGCSVYVGIFFNKCGFFLAYISDIFQFLWRFLKFMYDWFYPVFETVFEAIGYIFGSFFGLFGVGVKEFFSGYNIGLEGVWGKPIAYLLSLIIFFGGGVLLLFTIEAIGLALKIPQIRPSYYIVLLGDTFYSVFLFLTYIYGSITVCFSKFVEVIKKLLPFLKPYIDDLTVASTYVFAAVEDFMSSPFMGLVNGFSQSLGKLNTPLVRFAASTLMILSLIYVTGNSQKLFLVANCPLGIILLGIFSFYIYSILS
jgi:hypothetical protein